jgi:hypothetical protein
MVSTEQPLPLLPRLVLLLPPPLPLLLLPAICRSCIAGEGSGCI